MSVGKRTKQLLTAEERILIHLFDYSRYREDYEVPIEVTQDEIGVYTGILKNHVSRDMKRLMNKGFVDERLAKVYSLQRKRKAYFLTSKGFSVAQRLIASLSEMKVILKDGEKTSMLPLGEVNSRLSTEHSILYLARHVNEKNELDLASLCDSATQRDNKTKMEKKGRECITHFVYYPGKQNIIGREKELAILKKFIESEQRVLQIYGIAGSGKSALISHFVESYIGKRDIFWLGLHEWDNKKSICYALSEFLAKCGKRRLKSFLSTQEEIDMPRVNTLICEEFANISAIIVFDDVHRLNEDVYPVITSLVELATSNNEEMSERIKGLKLIFISRSLLPIYGRGKASLDKRFVEISLGGLDRDSAHELFVRANRNSDFEMVYKKSGGHPLALQLMEGEFNSFIRNEILLRLGHLEKKLLGMMSVFRVAVPMQIFCEGEKEREGIDTLLSLNLIREDTDGNLVMHELIQNYFYVRLGNSERDNAHYFAYKYHKSKGSVRDAAEGIYHLIKCEKYEDGARELLNVLEGAIKEGYLNEFYNYITEIEKRLLDTNLLIQLIKAKGDILLIWSEWREAFACYTKALNMLQMNFSSCRLNAKERGKQLGILYECIGIVHRNLDEYERARKYFENALSAYMQSEEKRGIASAQRNIGITYEALGKVKEALECYEASLAILEEIKDEVGIAETCNRIGILYNDELGDVLRARSYFEKSQSIYEMTKDMHRLAGIFANLAETYRQGPDAMWNVVKEMNLKALRIFDKYGDKQGVAVAYVNLGDAYCQQGEFDKAIDYFMRAVKIGESIGDKELQGEAYCGLGRAYFKDNRELAIDYFNRSIEIFEMIKMPNKAAKAREILASC